MLDEEVGRIDVAMADLRASLDRDTRHLNEIETLSLKFVAPRRPGRSSPASRSPPAHAVPSRSPVAKPEPAGYAGRPIM